MKQAPQLKIIKGGNRYASAVHGYDIPLPAWLYQQLVPIAARQGMSVTAFVNRVCEGVVELEPYPREVPFA